MQSHTQCYVREKSHGLDGFGVESYTTFKVMFLQTLKYSLKEGKHAKSQRKAFMILIEKKGKGETLINK